jgi:CubicO group peptidase (beta-lactamase class C family)
MKRFLIAGVAAWVISLPTVQADQLPFAWPEDVGMSSARLRQIENAVGEHLDKNHLAGAVTMVLRKGSIVHFEAHGWRDLESKTPMTKDSIFRIYSMTKPMVSAAVMMLVEEGRIQLDDPVGDHVPELVGVKVWTPDGEVDPKRPMSVRDLLRHTAGLTYGFFGNTPVDTAYREAQVLAPVDDAAAFEGKLGKLPLLYHPGEKWVYSVSVDVQGVLIERVSGQSLDRFLRERLFEPLVMRDTGFHVPPEKRDRFVTNYSPDDNGGLRVNDDPATSSYRFPPKFFSGGGGLVSTVADYSKFAQMMLNGGELFGERFLKKETVAYMTRNHLSDSAYPIGIGEDRPGVGFGLGVSVRVETSASEPDSRVGEYGWDGAASTHFWVSPEDELAVITMEQVMPYNSNLTAALKGLVYDALEP